MCDPNSLQRVNTSVKTIMLESWMFLAGPPISQEVPKTDLSPSWSQCPPLLV